MNDVFGKAKPNTKNNLAVIMKDGKIYEFDENKPLTFNLNKWFKWYKDYLY